MPKPATRWILESLRQPHTVAEVIEILLENRGWDRAALSGRLEDLEAEARSIRNLDEAAERVAAAVRAGQRIVLVGDYDCDGLTSVAQAARFLREAGFREFAALTPASRADGYGMPRDAIARYPDARLFLVFDCGTFDVEAVAAAREGGAEVVVVDHHEIKDLDGLAPASVLVNPRHPECGSAFKDFATAGLTLLFLARLRKALEACGGRRVALDGETLSLAAVGTIADMMPLRGANRIIAAHGLAALNRGCQPALQALRAVAGLSGRRLSAGHIGFQIGPRLNAAARVAEAKVALDLLLSEESAEIDRLANELDRLNRQRQQQVEQLTERLAAETSALGERRTLVLADRDYPLGINGILAQRLARDCYRPSILLQLFEDDGVAIGSGRSIPGFDLHAALGECADLLERWGGHALAAGLTLKIERLGEFRERLEGVGRRYPAAIFTPVERADLEISPCLISSELFEALGQLEPHGIGNPGPRFVLRDQRVTGTRTFGAAGRRDHLELVLAGGTRAVYWGGASGAKIRPGTTVDLVCGLSWDDYRGAPQLDVRDAGRLLLEPAAPPQAAVEACE